MLNANAIRKQVLDEVQKQLEKDNLKGLRGHLGFHGDDGVYWIPRSSVYNLLNKLGAQT